VILRRGGVNYTRPRKGGGGAKERLLPLPESSEEENLLQKKKTSALVFENREREEIFRHVSVNELQDCLSSREGEGGGY